MRRHCRGEAYLYRFADDFVAGFQYQTDAEDFLESLGKRMEEFHLELAQEKTRYLEFGRYARAHAYRRGEKPKEFTFRSCTRPLRIIVLPRKPGKMPLFHTDVRGRCHGVVPVFLPARTDHTRVAVLPASLCLAE